MRKAYSLARPVLDAGTAEQVEDALEVLRVDAAPVVLDLVAHVSAGVLAADHDPTRAAGREILGGVVDQVAEDLLQGEAVAGEVRSALDDELRPGPVELPAEAAVAVGEEAPHVDRLRRQDPAALARQLEDGPD